MAKGGHGAPADNVCQCTAMTDYCRIACFCAHGACAQPLFRFIDLVGGLHSSELIEDRRSGQKQITRLGVSKKSENPQGLILTAALVVFVGFFLRLRNLN